MAVWVNAGSQLPWLSIHADARHGRVPSIHLNVKLFPPRMKRAPRFADAQDQTLWRDVARELHPQEVPVLISKRLAVVHVQRTMTILPWINPKRERPLRRFFGALDQRLHRHDGPFSHKDGENFEVRLN